MRSLFLNILPQVMILIGLAGMAWMVAKGGFSFRHVHGWEKVRIGIDTARRIAAEKGMRFAEKSLRTAKIFAMRLERFFSAGLETIAAHKKGTAATRSFWTSVRERKIILRKARSVEEPQQDALVHQEKESDDVLARFAKEREEKKDDARDNVPR